MTLDYLKISLNIKSCRVRYNMNQSHVAEAIGVSTRCYRTLENDPKKMSMEQAVALADLFKTDLMNLLCIEINQIVNGETIGSVNGASTSYSNDLSVISAIYDRQIDFLKSEIEFLREKVK